MDEFEKMSEPARGARPAWMYYVDNEYYRDWRFLHKPTGVVYVMKDTRYGLRLVRADNELIYFNIHNAWAQRKHEFEKI